MGVTAVVGVMGTGAAVEGTGKVNVESESEGVSCTLLSNGCNGRVTNWPRCGSGNIYILCTTPTNTIAKFFYLKATVPEKIAVGYLARWPIAQKGYRAYGILTSQPVPSALE